MFKHRAIPMGLIGLLAVLVLMGAVTDFRALNRGDLGLVYPLDTDTCGTALTSATLSCRIMAIRANRQTLMIPPGTWTINANLTVPSNIGLWVAEGAMFNISAGITLTINGSLTAPMAPIVSGAGSVVFGARVSEISPYWFGAACDDATNDAPALTRTFAAASASGRRVVRLPAATCRITSEVDFRGVSIYGQGIHTSKIMVAGNTIRGLYYDGNGEDSDLVLQGFHIEGSNGASGGTGTLIEIKEAKGVTVNNVSVFKTGVYGIYFDFVVNYSIRNTAIRGCLRSCLALKNNSNAGSVRDSWFEADLGIEEWLDGAIYIVGSTAITFSGNAIEGEGIGRGQVGTVIEGAGFLLFFNNFYEFLEDNVFQADTVASGDITLINNHIHCQCNFPLLFSFGDLGHTNIKITDNHFVGVNANSKLFSPGSGTLMFEFRHNTRDQAAGTCVQGFNRCHLIFTPGNDFLTIRDGLGIVRGIESLNKSLAASADGTEIQVNHADPSGKVSLRAAGNTQAQAQQKGLLVTRLHGELGGELVSGDFSLHANWGSGATVSDIVGTDTAFSFQVNSGSSGVGVNPSITITFHDGSWRASAIPVVVRSGGNNLGTAITRSITSTQLTINFMGTPDTNGTFGFDVHIIGR
jgi:hypothetical protein